MTVFTKPVTPALQGGNSLATGLVRMFPVTEGSGSTLHDLSTSAQNVSTYLNNTITPLTWASDPTFGENIALGSDESWAGFDTGLQTGNGARSHAFLFKTAFSCASSAEIGFYVYGATSPSAELDLILLVQQGSNTGTQGSMQWTDGTNNAADSSDTVINDNAWHLGLAVYNGTSWSYYVDSATAVSTGNTPSPSGTLSTVLGGTNQSLVFANRPTSATLNFDGLFGAFWSWTRALSSGDITNFYADPYQMVRPALAAGTASTVSSGNTIATVTCTAATGGTVPYTYQWYRSTTSGFTPGGGNIVSGATSLTLNDTGLTNGTTYYYKLVATDAQSVTSISNQTSATPSAGAAFTISPSTSTNAQSVVYTATGTSTSWISPGTVFNITGVTGASITSQSVNQGAQTASITVLLDNTHTGTLTFADNTDAATATSAVTLAGPGAPRSLSVSPGNTQNVLNWLAPNTGGLVATYNVYRGTTPGGESGTPIQTGITALTFTDTGLTNGQIYYYYVKAVNATATGAQSNEASGTPSATGVGNLSAAQALTALAVLTHSASTPFLYNNATAIEVRGAEYAIPLSAGNLALGAALVNGVDSNNIYLGLIEGDAASGLGTSNSAVGSSGVSGGGAGGLSAAQFLAALGALMHNIQPPFLTTNQTGVYFAANQLVIPQTANNNALGSALVLSTDGTFVYISLNPGDPGG